MDAPGQPETRPGSQAGQHHAAGQQGASGYLGHRMSSLTDAGKLPGRYLATARMGRRQVLAAHAGTELGHHTTRAITTGHRRERRKMTARSPQRQQLQDLLDPVVSAAGYELVDLSVSSAGRR